MELNILGSNSLGNCYVLQNEKEALVVECGIDFRDVTKAVGYDIRKIACCVVSHEHNDHSGHIRKFVENGILTLALPEVFNSKCLSGCFCKSIVVGKAYKVGNFIVQSFSLHHDTACVGWVIRHPEIGKLVFATDTTHVDYHFPGIGNMLIEANYIDEIVDRKIAEGNEHAIRSHKRLMRSHMEFEATKTFVRNNLSDSLRNIVLIHLSDGNSDEERMVSEIKAIAGVPTYAADKGKTIYLSY